MNEPFDLAVIGGGVNGAGIARDAAGRGAKVLLLEAGDLAQGKRMGREGTPGWAASLHREVLNQKREERKERAAPPTDCKQE